MRHVIPTRNWTIALAHAIDVAQPGDTIIVHNNSMLELAQNAHARMCPDKKVTFVVEDPHRGIDSFSSV